MRLEIKTDIVKLQRELDDVARRQIPFAVANTLNELAFDQRKEQQKQMRSIFDRPTPWTLGSLHVRKTNKREFPKGGASVKFDEFGAKGTAGGTYLQPQVHGGTRRPTRTERHLRSKGILPSGKFVYPARAARKNKYGNIPASKYTEMLSDLGAQFDPKQNRTGSKAKYFVFQKGAKAAGIATLMGGELVPFLVFGKAPTYTERYRFFDIGERHFKRNYDRTFGKQLGRAIRTARR